ncbi:MAG: DUF4430 domain-containing protein [Clostridiales bacterium]|nr:DUF4430 domain-containing protein [Clostridiales bacterium]
MKRFLPLFLSVLMLLSLVGCGGNAGQPAGNKVIEDGATIGEGEKSFVTEVVDADGNTVKFTVQTNEKTVGEALQKLGVIDGEEGDYGLYIKTVNGITADYNKDGVYWAFYVDGEYAMTGADMTDVVDGTVYTFRVEK